MSLRSFALALAFCACLPVLAQEPNTPAEAFQQNLATQVAKAEGAKASVIPGANGWLFFVPELRYLSVGPFWGDNAAKVSHALSPEGADPLPAILDFKRQLDRIGVELLVVPVPAKAQIYPDDIAGDVITVAKNADPPRLDRDQTAFYAELAKQGVKVLDLTPTFLKNRRSATDGYLYCQQDTHWSSRGCALAAATIATAINTRPWLKAITKHKYTVASKTVAINGDMAEMNGAPKVSAETLKVAVVSEVKAGAKNPAGSWRQSPIVLLGDSHNLVFSTGGDMLVAGAGLPDHLARQLGFPVDVVAVRGSGATPARVNLLRRGDKLAGKKLIIWCFTVREFTEGQGWRKVPIIK